MNHSRLALAARRERLCASIERQRDDFAVQLAPWRGRIAAVDQALGVLRTLRHNPLWIAGGVLLLAVAGPRKTRRGWLEVGLVVWQFLHVGRRR